MAEFAVTESTLKALLYAVSVRTLFSTFLSYECGGKVQVEGNLLLVAQVFVLTSWSEASIITFFKP